MIRCLTIDDSPLALDLLDDYINKTDDLKLVKRCTNALEALELIRSGNIDLIFLDIQMPDITGIDLLKSLKNKPKVIFTTAFTDYAVEGFNLDATDYLLKPFSYERFRKAVDKVIQQSRLEKNQTEEKSNIFIKSGHETLKILTEEILYIEALRDYVQIFTKKQKILSLISMKEFMGMLPAEEFIRIHRSYIISLDKISKISARKVLVGNKEIPVGDNYKDEFHVLLKKRKIIL
jgi:DNA-binding LytR/AlgR family response regulator